MCEDRKIRNFIKKFKILLEKFQNLFNFVEKWILVKNNSPQHISSNIFWRHTTNEGRNEEMNEWMNYSRKIKENRDMN